MNKCRIKASGSPQGDYSHKESKEDKRVFQTHQDGLGKTKRLLEIAIDACIRALLYDIEEIWEDVEIYCPLVCRMLNSIPVEREWRGTSFDRSG